MPRSFAILALLFSIRMFGAGPPEVIQLWPGIPANGGEEVWVERGKGIVDRAVSNVHQPTLTVYLPPKGKANGAAVVIAPGGGFTHLAIDKEGYDVAKWLNRIGVAGFVLKYRLKNAGDSAYTVETPHEDALRALRTVRSRAKEWGIDPNRVGMMGFSAGGALAALAGTKYDTQPTGATDPIDRQNARPDFLVIGYGAIPADVVVTAKTPPAFLVHADDDHLSAERSASFYEALKKAGVSAELHVFARGGHGFGIADSGLPVAKWPKLCEDWLESQGFLRDRTLDAYAGKTPVLDGVISPGEWSDATEFFGVRDWIPQFSPTNDPKDLSLHGYVKHDGKRLYFAFDVTDDVLYGIDTPRWVPAENPKAHELTRQGFPWFGDEMELLINAAQSLDRPGVQAAGDGSRSWQMVCNLTKSRKGGIGCRRFARRRASQQGRPPGTRTRSGFVSVSAGSGGQAEAGGKGLRDRMGRQFSLIRASKWSQDSFIPHRWEIALVGLNIALGDLDEMAKGAGNQFHFHHEDWFSGAKNTRTQLRQWGTLWIRTSKMPARR